MLERIETFIAGFNPVQKIGLVAMTIILLMLFA